MQSSKLVYKFSALILLSTSTFTPVYSQPSESSLADIVRQARVIDPSAKLHATVSGDEVDVTSESTPKSNDDACKVQAILVAKAIFDSQPDSIQKTKVILFDYSSNKCRTIVVKRAEIKTYASNGMSQKALLSSIDFNVSGAGGVNQQADLKVADGPLQNERLLLLGRIMKMKTAGTNVTAFISIFNDLEATATTKDQAKTQAKLEYVADKVDEQEKTISAAKAKSSAQETYAMGGAGRQTFGGAYATRGGNAHDAADADALMRLAHDAMPQGDKALFALAFRQNALKEKIVAFKVLNPEFVGNDEMTMGEIESAIGHGDIAGAQRMMLRLEQKYARSP